MSTGKGNQLFNFKKKTQKNFKPDSLGRVC